jgi:membrane associated rhomboid family serine protease
MSEPSNELLATLLREVGAAAPNPWYPAAYAQSTGTPRDAVDSRLDQLRLGGLVRLTDWIQDKGQGYAVTEEGEEVLRTPRLLERLRRGEVKVKSVDSSPAPFEVDGRPSSWERGEKVRKAILEPPTPYITYALLLTNILVFLVGLGLAVHAGVAREYLDPPKEFGQVAEIHSLLGALWTPNVFFKGEWWRIGSYFFVHMGLLHIFMNMFFLYMLGPRLEGMWGHVGFLVVYVLSGLGGGVAVLLFQPLALTAGASGALCGILASMPVWILLNYAYLPSQLAANWLRSIVMDLILIAFISFLPGISAAGHFGGAAVGAAAAVPMVLLRFASGPKRWLGLLGLVLVAAIVGLLFQRAWAANRPHDALQALRAADQAAITAFEEHARPFFGVFQTRTIVKETVRFPPLAGFDKHRYLFEAASWQTWTALQNLLPGRTVVEEKASPGPGIFFKDPQRRRATWIAFQAVDTKLSQALDSFSVTDPSFDTRTEAVRQIGQDYVQVWRAFFATFSCFLEDCEVDATERWNGLRSQAYRVFVYRSLLKERKLL